MEPLVVLFAKAVDDKEDGIYLEDVYFGGVAYGKDDAERIAKNCTNNTRGGTAIVRIMPIKAQNTLLEVFREAKLRFDKLERQMVETEGILLANNQRAKKRRK